MPADEAPIGASEFVKFIKLPAVIGYVVAFEFLVVASSTYLASTIYHYASFGVLPPHSQYIIEALYVALVFTSVSLGFRHFAVEQIQELHTLLWNGIGAVALAFVIFLSTTFLLKISKDYSRGAFLTQVVSVGISICIFRAILLLWLRTAVAAGSIETRRAILIGNTVCCARTAMDLKAAGIRVIASFALPCDDETSIVPDNGKPALNSSARNVVNLCRQMLPDDIVILAEYRDFFLASDLAKHFSELPCDVHIAPLDGIRFVTRSQIADLGNLRTLRVSRQPLSFADLAIKRTFDIVVAATALVVLSPLLLIVALAIKIDSPGSVLFRQLRHGYNNRVIRVYKFRSMEAHPDDDGRSFAPTQENDERVTAVGRILRRTNIDELPQLINVVLGEMSIVGPRPHATDHNKMFEDQILPFARRHNVKPGITGWAQVNGCRGPADTVEKMQKRVEYDLVYIDTWSFFLDLKIILMTLFSKKAYLNAF